MSFYQTIALLCGEVLFYVLIFFVIQRFFRKDKTTFVHLVITLLVTGGIISLIKILFPVARPYVELGAFPLTTGINPYTSFPSSHAGGAMAIASYVWFIRHPMRKVILLTAVGVIIGRILLFVHSPLDVLVGAGIGFVVSFIVWRVAIVKPE